MANKRYDQFAAGTYDTSKIFLQADAVTGALEKIFLPTINNYSGTANRITITALAIDIAATYVGQASITTLGTISTGIWNATTIGISKGGTNLTTYTTGDILYASAANVLSKLAAGTNGQVLTLAAGVPSWAGSSSGWGLTGNAGTTAGTNFIGTTDNIEFVVKTNGAQRFKFSSTNANVFFYPPVSGADQNVISIWRQGSTVTKAFDFGLTSTDDLFINTANADITFRRSTVEVMKIKGAGGVAIQSVGAFDARITLPTGTNLNWGLITGTTAGGNRCNIGIDASENAVMQLGHCSLRIRESLAASDLFLIDVGGNVTIEKNASALTTTACAKLAITTTTGGVLFPRMTTTQKNAIGSPVNGLVVYDTTLAKLCVYTTAWEVITSL